jgi:O-antigen/teichoic acid export membrane protein
MIFLNYVNIIKKFFDSMRSKFVVDMLFNCVSFGVLAVSGISINMVIASFYGASALGRFNIVYAIYIVAVQLCTCGVHYSVLKHLAVKLTYSKDQSVIICSAIVLILILSVVVTICLFLFSNFIGTVFKSPTIVGGVKCMAPALLFFAMNKTILAALNGLRFMRIFAFGQAIRYFFMIGFIASIAFYKGNEVYLNLNYLFAEMVLFSLLSVLLIKSIKGFDFAIQKKWIIEHMVFGFKGFLVGIFVELNTRIDVLILGLFVSSNLVGVYAFIAMLVDGLYQFLVVIKNNINPILAYYIAENRFVDLGVLFKKVRTVTCILMFALCIVLFLVYPSIIFILCKPDFKQGHIPLLFLLIGLFFGSGFLPFGDILTQSGYPGWQTTQNFLVVVTNAILNIFFIYYWGIVGCAIATALATYVFSIYYLEYFAVKHIGFSLLKMQPIVK